MRLASKSVAHGQPVHLAVTDAGSGVDASSLIVRVDGHVADHGFRGGVLSVGTARLKAGRHTVRVVVADYQETRNMENVGPILPNTRTFTASFTVR